MRTLVLAIVLGMAAPAHAGNDYFAKPNDSSKVTVVHGRSRTTRQRLLLAGLVLGAAATGGLGLYFNLQSRDAASSLSETHGRLVGTWTPALQDTYDRAKTDGDLAIAGYALAGALFAGSMVAVYFTDPGRASTQLAPTAALVKGGAVVGGSVHF